jgi:3-hydroxybutyryl-CoA dehydrogenase
MTVEPVGVVGAGTIGREVAFGLAATGHRVVLVDLDEGILARSTAGIRRSLRTARLLGKGPAEADTLVLARIEATTDYRDLAGIRFVIENTTEDWPVKQDVYGRLGEVCAPGTVLAANTSCIPVTRIGAHSGRPEHVIGMHFMNPVAHLPVVEVIRGEHTSDDTVDRAHELLARMGKTGILVGDSPGFVTNRILMVAVNEAAYLVHEQVAGPADIDRVVRSCFGHRMGMLETADLIGIDTVLRSIEMLYESFRDSKYRPCPLLRRMVDAGRLGRKSGRGFYTYDRG